MLTMVDTTLAPKSVIMRVNEERDIKRKLNVINFAKQIGNVKKACRYYEFKIAVVVSDMVWDGTGFVMFQ